MTQEDGCLSKYDWNKYWQVRIHAKSRYLWLKRFAINLKYRLEFRRVLSGLQLNEPSVLMLGAGTGALVVKMIEEFGGSALFLDYSPDAYHTFKSLNPPTTIKYLVQDLRDFHSDETFDFSVSDGLLEHLDGDLLTLALDKHKRYLKPTGHVIIVAPKKNLYWSFRAIALRSESTCNLFGKIGITRSAMVYDYHTKLDTLTNLLRDHGLQVEKVVSGYASNVVLCKPK